MGNTVDDIKRRMEFIQRHSFYGIAVESLPVETHFGIEYVRKDDIVDMMFKQDVIDKIWDIAKNSPEHGNALMDLLGEARYNFVMTHHTPEKKES